MKSHLLKDKITLLPYGLTDKVNRSNYGNLSFILAFIIGFITLFIWLTQNIGAIAEPLLFIAKGSALVGICLLSAAIFLSLRLHFMESIFGGLDKIYKAHHLLGQITFLVIFFHPLFLILRSIYNFDLILLYIIPGKNMPYTYGIISFLLLIILLVLTLILRLPYKIWHLSHKFMGITLILATWHAVTSGSAINQYQILRGWISIISLIGIFSYLYMLFLYQYIGPKQKAIVKHVKNKGEITEIKFEVNAKKFRFVPGQFVFIKFINLEKSFELFPFSISCSHKDDLIRISAKRSGDFTSNILPKVKVGDIVYLYGPYGKFGEKFLYEKNDMLWIAGGIGVTPFLSMIHEASDKNIDFVWASKDKKDAIYDKEIKEIISDKKSIRYNLWISKDSGRISAHKIMKMFDSEANIKEKLIFICGPTQMMMDIANQFVKIGVPPRHIIFEDFNLL